MTWKAYQILPIDFDWEFLPSIEVVAAQLATREASEIVEGHDSGTTRVAKFLEDFKHARELAKAVGWEGDYRNEPCVFWIPTEGGFSYCFVWKHDNNGDTFVVSPVPLKWLERLQ